MEEDGVSPAVGHLAHTGGGAASQVACQVLPPFLLAGMGMVVSGSLLDDVSTNWTVFKENPALLILVPALLGLKGNLEMTLGARLCTHANHIPSQLKGDDFWPILKGNLCAVQCQAIVVGAVASLLAIMEDALTDESDISPAAAGKPQALLLAASAITAASMASFFLSLLMTGIVVAASNCGIDPDNITAPIAGMLGDFCTLGVVCLVASGFWQLDEDAFKMLYGLLVAYVLIAVWCAYSAYNIHFTKEVMQLGWYPVLASMVLSNFSGPIAMNSTEKYKRFALFQVVMNGAGGNLGSILASKLTTDLAQAEEGLEELLKEGVPKKKKSLMVRGSFRSLTKDLRTLGKTQKEHQKQAHDKVKTSWVDMSEDQTYAKNWFTVKVLTGPGSMSRVARVLLGLIIPGQFIFATVVVAVASGFSAIPCPKFVCIFIMGSICQTTILQMCARTAVVVFWRCKIDPDNFASPLVCGMGDLIGTSFLTLTFMLTETLGGEVWPGSGV